MRKALFILGELNDADVEWLARRGQRRALADGEVIVTEGRPIDALFITLAGRLRVTLRNGQELSRLGVGEVVGEVAFVNSSPPTASVAAVGESVVLALPRGVLQQQLADDPPFAARFYRALAISLAARLRAATRRESGAPAGGLDDAAMADDQLDRGVLDTVAQAGERFTRLLRTLAAASPA